MLQDDLAFRPFLTVVWDVIDSHHVLLRAEHASRGTGRTDSIQMTATDSH
jgi:hypothetical protein